MKSLISFEKQSTAPALHTYNTVGPIMDSLKQMIQIETAETEIIFLLKTWCLHYP